jgi:hypothetical protein
VLGDGNVDADLVWAVLRRLTIAGTVRPTFSDPRSATGVSSRCSTPC